MKKAGFLKKVLAFSLAVILGIAPCISELGTLTVYAKQTKGSSSYADSESEVVGQWSYWDGNQNVYKTNASLLEKLPYEGREYRLTTDNYDANFGAFDTSNWATSFMWDLDGDNKYSSTVYAIPLAFRASVDGGASNVIQVTAPSSLSDAANNTFTMQMASNGSITDFFIQTPFATSSAKVDKVTDWTYDVVLEKSDDSSTYMKTTMVQGSIFAYFEMAKSNTLTILRGKQLPASIAYQNPAGNIIVIRCEDNGDQDYDYYAFYGAEGTTFNTTMNGNKIDSVVVNFSGDAYMTLAYLGSTESINDTWGASMCQAYQPYAYNFVTDTRATYSYNEATSTLETTYTYILDSKKESTGEGTIMGVLPHQYKNIKAGTSFLSYVYPTVRGNMKTIAGTSFQTELTYSGILPFMPDYTEDVADESEEDTAIKTYLQDYLDYVTDPETGDIVYFRNYEGTGDTYWDGKGLNRIGNAMVAAYAAGDSHADEMYEALKARLEEWLTYSGADDTTYFYYDEGVGSMFGFPQSYDSVNQINDHHFHYGYFIYAAAQIAFRDKEWAEAYGGLIEELIYDIACPVRNNPNSKYPYLRNFAPYEGHSWASGHGNFDMGNNQESSSEALNAWAGIILWGEATGNDAIRDLGIYLYTTEVSAVQNYWYDVDEDVLHDAYRYDVELNDLGNVNTETAEVVNNSAAIVWGGSYTYATWFSANPLYIQGINLLPMNPTCFYLAGDPDYIQQNWDLAYAKAAAGIDPNTGAAWDPKSWVDIWCQYYAMAYPEAALTKWRNVEQEGYGVEGGDTKAHTYHYIMTMCTYGTPDTSISSDATLSTVFVKDGVKTYCAYNAENTAKTVNFSDGYQLTVAANSMGVEKEGSAENQKKYTIEYYLQNTDGSYSVDNSKTQSKYGVVGSNASVSATEIEGYTFDNDNANNVLSASVAADGSTVLKLYYERATYTITYELDGGDQNPGNPTTYQYKDSVLLLEPTKTGFVFTGWYTSPALTEEVTNIKATDMGNIVLYAGWKDPYVYEMDASKTITYEDGKIVLRVSGESPSYSVTVYCGFYGSKEAAAAITSQNGVAGLPGYGLTYDENEGVWKYTWESGFTTGQFLVLKLNITRNGQGEESGWGTFEVPDPSGNTAITYYETHYKENINGGYDLADTVKKKVEPGTNVTITEKAYNGFELDADNANNVKTATITAENEGTALKLYYNRRTYSISYNLNGGTNAVNNPTSYKYGSTVTLEEPTLTDKVFIGWYTDEALTVAFSGIKSNTYGDITLWAKWGDAAAAQASYTVEHYKQTAAGSAEYTKAETQTLSGEVGATVTAVAKTYDGYIENTTHASRVPSGTILANGSLTLKLYYDVVNTGGEGGDEGGGGSTTPEGYGFTYDVATGKATFYYTGAIGGIVFIKVCDDEATAQGYVEAANASLPGFDAVPGHSGNALVATETGAELEYAVEEGKYIVYAFNPNIDGVEQGIASWYYAQATTTSGPVTPPPATEKVEYTVKHYQQNTDLKGYTEAASEVLSADEGTLVEAVVRSYDGFTHNSGVSGTLLSGTLDADTELVLSVYYDRNKYAINYNNMEGATNPSGNAAQYVYGVGLTLKNPSKTGFRFEGWYEDAECTTTPITAIAADRIGDVTIYAKWTEITDPLEAASFIVKYYLETDLEGRYAEVIADSYTGSGYAGDVIEADIKNYAGYVFNENASGNCLSGTLDSQVCLVLKVYYDREDYKVTYHNMEGATNPESNKATYTYGAGFTLAEPTRTDWIFEGWFLDENFTIQVTKITDLQTGDLNLYAKWTKEQVEYTVSYFIQNTALNGYSELTGEKVKVTVDAGTVIDALKAGYNKEIAGFTFNAEYEGSCLSGTAQKAEPLALKLYYDRNTYKITYANMEGATNAESNVAGYVYGAGLTLQNPVKENYSFAGWYLDETFAEESKILAIGKTQTGDVTVYAKWIEEAQSAAYTVEYYLQSTTLRSYQEIEEERYSGIGEIGKTVVAPTKEFDGFVLNAEAEGTLTSGELTAEGTLVLKVYYDRASYAVTYHNMEDAKNPAANKSTYTYGIGLTLRNPEKDGFIFAGWYTSEDFNEESAITKISTEQMGAVDVYAKWTVYAPEIEGDEEVDDSFTVDTIEPQYYTGSKIIPAIVVKDGDKVLVEKKDYTLKVINNINAGNGVVKITGKGNYSGTVEKQFEILPVDIGGDEFSAEDIYVAYNKGRAIKVAPKLIWGKKTLKLNKDYTITGATSYSAVGTYTVTLKGMTNFEGERTLQFEVTDQTLMSKVKIAAIPKQFYKNGEELTPELNVTYKGEALTENTDYTVEYLNNTQAGTATVILTGIGEKYVGTKKATFKIVGTELKKMALDLTATEFEYTGSTILPGYYAGNLQAGRDFTVTYSNNIKVGKGTVTFTGIGAYSGTVKKTFKIVPYNLANNVADFLEDATGELEVEYQKGGNTPSVDLYFRGKKLTEGVDYTLQYKDNKALGTAKLIAKGKGSFQGSYVKDFTITKNDMDNLIVIADDIVSKPGKPASYYMAKVTVTDVNGKKLAVNKDYQIVSYKYSSDSGMTEFGKTSAIGTLETGTTLEVTIKGLNFYDGEVPKEYTVVPASIKSAKVVITPQQFTGEEITLEKEDITVTLGGVPVAKEYFEIVEGSYINNVKKGTAKVTIRGVGSYGGYKTVSFKITQRSVGGAIAGIFGF